MQARGSEDGLASRLRDRLAAAAKVMAPPAPQALTEDPQLSGAAQRHADGADDLATAAVAGCGGVLQAEVADLQTGVVPRRGRGRPRKVSCCPRLSGHMPAQHSCTAVMFSMASQQSLFAGMLGLCF